VRWSITVSFFPRFALKKGDTVMPDVKIAYALVSSKNYLQPNPTMLSSDHVKEVINDTQGSYIVSFQDNYFNNTPVVQVTALFNGWQGNNDLNPINTSGTPPNSAPANQVVHACVEWVTTHSCRVITSLNNAQLNSWSLSFSITAIGN
jgi:hypothetical protein